MEIDPLPNGNSAVNSASTTAAPMVTAPSSNLAQLTESLKLEHQFVRVPFEHYKKTIRVNHRAVEKEISSVVSSVNEAADSDLSRDDAVQHLSSLVSRLHGLKRKLEEGSRTENLQAQRCRARLDHLESADADNLTEWSNTRLKRILVDYMLRMSYYDTAMKLAQSSNIQDLVDIDVFQEARSVIDALHNKEVAPALAWCTDNRSRLKKSKSKLEFQLRLQEFVELVRADNYMRAIAYARKYLSPWGATHMKELQRGMATLAFRRDTECATYKVILYRHQQIFFHTAS
ncbi:Protein MAEA homolog [Linum perenne]